MSQRNWFIVSIIILSIFLLPLLNQLSIKIEKFTLAKPKPALLKQVQGSHAQSSSESGKIKYPVDFTIVLVGDSMTQYLGNSDELKAYLSEYYPGKTFEVLNYGFGATNILSVPDRLEKSSTNVGRNYDPIDNVDYDLLILESFGNNPLSQYKVPDGLKKQDETLDKIIESISKNGKKNNLVFMATIAPNTKDYAKGEVDLTPEKRAIWAKERVAYIENHIDYAKKHNIPLIDVYDKSRDWFGEGKNIYINPADNIHPSPTGVIFLSHEIANFIKQNNLVK